MEKKGAKDGWVCRGYGSPHGYRKGRLWFACPACRWSSPSNPGAAPGKKVKDK